MQCKGIYSTILTIKKESQFTAILDKVLPQNRLVDGI